MPSRSLAVGWVFARHWGRALVRARFGLVSAEKRRACLAVGTREALEDAGPTFVKLGQLLSVRPDVFSAELVFELSRLRDAAPTIPLEHVLAAVERELGRPADEVFARFDPVPVASASIAQVHGARLRAEARPAWGTPLAAGSKVAVKVLRPGVEDAIELDLAWARRLSRRLRWLPWIQRVGVAGILDEFETSLREETDMRREGRTADRFAFDFRDDDVVTVPRVVWPLTTRSILTMEYVDGWRLSDLDTGARAGIDGESLARHGAVAFMRQVLVHGRFHADLHPANLFVTPDGHIAYLDFGIVGRLDEAARRSVAGILGAIVDADPRSALERASALGLRIPPHRRSRLEEDLAALMERTLVESRDVRHFGLGLLRLLGRHRVAIPRGFGLLVKGLVTVEGVARALYPQIDIIETARPFVAALRAPALLYSRSRASLRLPVR